MSTPRRLFFWSWVGLLLLTAHPVQAVETYSGSEFRTLAKAAVDAMQLSSEQQRYELARDRSERFSILLSYRASPSRFILSNGSELGGGLARFRGGIGGGDGKPATGFGWFIGAYADQAYVSNWPALHQVNREVDATMLQYFLTARVGYEGTSLSYGFLGHNGSLLNAAGEFGELPSYRGGPRAEAQATLTDGAQDDPAFGPNTHMLSLRHKFRPPDLGGGGGATIAL